MATLLNLPGELRSDGVPVAADLVRRYFDLSLAGGYYTGAMFERLDGGGDRHGVRNHFTGADLEAVKMLSIRVPRRMVAELADRHAQLGTLLSQIPHDVDLVDAGPELINDDSAAAQLWARLNEVQGIGWVVANKLLARKRPRLIPVYDSDVRALLGAPDGFWASLQTTLRADDRALHHRLLAIREEAGVGEDVSPLRVFDVVCWMVAQQREKDREA